LESIVMEYTGEMDPELGWEITRAYVRFADSFPADSLTPMYLFRAGEVARHLDGKQLYAVTYFDRVYADYPDFSLAGQALFLIGVTFADMGDKERAAKTYRHFIDTYPEHPLRAEVETLLQLARDTVPLEMRVEGWLNEAEENNHSK